MASVRKIELDDGSTRWRVRVYAGRDPETGRRRYVTSTHDRKKDADAEATRLERRKDTGHFTTPSRDTFATYLGHWLDNVKAGRIRARTLEDYRDIVRRYILRPPDGAPLIGSIRMDQLGAPAFEALYAFLWKEEGLAPRTLQYLHSVLRQALRHAVETGSLARNPTDAVRPPRQAAKGGTPKKVMRAMTRDEAGRFLDAASGDDLAALWHVLLMGGLRPGEAFALRWPDVDLDGGKLHVRHSLTRRGVPKLCAGCGHGYADHTGACGVSGCACDAYDGSKGWKLTEPKTARARRVVVLPDVATRTLREHRRQQAEHRLQAGAEYRDHDFVFTTTFGSPLDPPRVHRRFRAILKRAELAKFRPYDLRHSCATFLLLAGENPKVVSERLGHASITLTLDTYSHVLPSMQEESARRLDAMFGTA